MTFITFNNKLITFKKFSNLKMLNLKSSYLLEQIANNSLCYVIQWRLYTEIFLQMSSGFTQLSLVVTNYYAAVVAFFEKYFDFITIISTKDKFGIAIHINFLAIRVTKEEIGLVFWWHAYFANEKDLAINKDMYKHVKPNVYFSINSTAVDIYTNDLMLNKTNSNNKAIKLMEQEYYLKNQDQLLKKIDLDFWKQTTTKNFLFYTNYDLFEYQTSIPFEKINKLDDIFFKNFNLLNFFSITENLISLELASNFYFEPFFFFREKIQYSLDEFWLISHFRERAMLFDSWVYHPNIVANDPTHVFPPLSHLAHSSDFKAGLKYFKRLFNYKNNKNYSYYLDFSDIQKYAIDKNFVHLWNYWIGTYNSLNIFSNWGWTGFINYLREKITSPKIHFDSTYYRTNNAYGSYSSRVIQFAFFPDFALLWGQFNPNFDWLTTGYNRTFHFGETFMDSAIALDLVWFQITENYWGDFEHLAEDYAAYQSSYFPDNTATIWIPIILLATKTFSSKSEMAIHINDYNNVFMFKQFKQYKNLRADIFFKLDRLTKLKILRDGEPIDQWVFNIEKIINLYFAYNCSNFISNQPQWLTSLNNPYDFYSSLFYDTNEDLNLEDREWKIINSFWSQANPINIKPSIYYDTSNFNSFFFNLPRFLNEKIFDDLGYLTTIINRGDEYKNDRSFNWLTKFSILHVEYLPVNHYNWRVTLLETFSFEWNFLNLNLELFSYAKLVDYFFQSFSLKIVNLDFIINFTNKNELVYLTTKLPALFFKFDFLPLIAYFWEFHKKNSFIHILDYLGYSYANLITKLLPISNFFKINDILIYFPNFSNKFYFYYKIFFFDKLIIVNNFIDRYQLLFNIKSNLYFFSKILLEFFFFHEHFTIYIISYIPEKEKQLIYCVDKIEIKHQLLPLEFFIPIFKYSEDCFLIEWTALRINLDNAKCLLTLNNIPITKLVELQLFIDYWTVNSLDKEQINATQINKLISIINWLDYSSLKSKSLDYDRYVNYVKKKTLYKKNY